MMSCSVVVQHSDADACSQMLLSPLVLCLHNDTCTSLIMHARLGCRTTHIEQVSIPGLVKRQGNVPGDRAVDIPS